MLKFRIVFIALLILNSALKAQNKSKILPYKMGIVLSGGAARGFAHIGVLRAFEEAGVEIDCISGSSMGAVVGLLYAAGKTPDEMLTIAKTLKTRKLKKIGIFHFEKTGLSYIEHFLKIHIIQRDFEELQKPLFVCVANFETGKYEIIESGKIFPALLASAAIPILFGEQTVNGVSYIDGGVLNNLPTEPLRKCCETVVGISVNPLVEKKGKMNIRQKIIRLCELVINENETERIKMCDYHLEVAGLENFDFEDYKSVQEIHDMGYRAAKNFIAENWGEIND